MKKIAVLCNSKLFPNYASKIKSALKSKNLQVELIYSDDLVLNNQRIVDFDLIYSRLSGLKWTQEILSQIGAKGLKIIPNLDYCKNVQNKYISTVIAQNFGIKTPKTYLISTYPQFYGENSELAKALEYPFILKPLYSSLKGEYCYKINDNKELQRYISDLFKCHCEGTDVIGVYDYGIIQELINYQSLIRSVIIEGKTIGSGYVSPEGWKCSVCSNPNIQLYEIDSKLEKFNKKIFQAFKGEIMIVDAFETENGVIFNECNTACGLFNLEKVTRKNFAEIIANYLFKQIKK